MVGEMQLISLYFLVLSSLCEGVPSSFTGFRFGSPDKIGQFSPEPDGSKDYIMWDEDALPLGPFPRQVSVCFNMRYLTMDYWSSGQKTILRIFQAKEKPFWLRITHAPPRGTMILNSGNLYSGGLGDFR